jgi:hypothetical protein
LNQEFKINWGTIAKYDTGGFNSIAMDDNGHCIEVHVASLKLFYRVGTVNFDTQKIDWGTSIQYDTGRFNSIAMDNNGHCIETHVDFGGNLFYRVGIVNFDTHTIDWRTSTQYDTGGFNSIAMDNNGHCIEVNGDYRGNLFFRVGNVKECSLQPVPPVDYFTTGTVEKVLKFDHCVSSLYKKKEIS